jgi:hypothetical protein
MTIIFTSVGVLLASIHLFFYSLQIFLSSQTIPQDERNQDRLAQVHVEKKGKSYNHRSKTRFPFTPHLRNRGLSPLHLFRSYLISFYCGADSVLRAEFRFKPNRLQILPSGERKFSVPLREKKVGDTDKKQCS